MLGVLQSTKTCNILLLHFAHHQPPHPTIAPNTRHGAALEAVDSAFSRCRRSCLLLPRETLVQRGMKTRCFVPYFRFRMSEHCWRGTHVTRCFFLCHRPTLCRPTKLTGTYLQLCVSSRVCVAPPVPPGTFIRFSFRFQNLNEFPDFPQFLQLSCAFFSTEYR
jgi:hypothetical protein